jgi:MOSC domain-containing protein YiiM
MRGKVVQVNISHGGVPKLPVQQALMTARGVQGDRYAHPQIHGGPKQAVLWITAEGTAELVARGFALYSGALGENITTRGIDRRIWRAGQRWHVGQQAVIELTKLRQPCATLSVYGPNIQAELFDARMRAEDPSSPRWGLGGFYAAVIRDGVVQAGDEVWFAEPESAG